MVTMDSMSLIGVVADSNQFSITSLLTNLGKQLNTWGSLIVFIFGLVAIIASVYMIVTGMISHGKKQTSWPIAIGLLIIGGVCTAGGSSGAWLFVANNIAGGGQQTVKDMAEGNSGNASVSISTVMFSATDNVVLI